LPQIYDRQTGQPIAPSPEDAHAGLVSGQYALDADGGPVTLIGASGKTYEADPNKVANALATNKYRLQTPDEELKSRVAKQEAAKGVAGSVTEAAKSFANQALLGIPGAIAEANETPEQKAEREAREAYHATGRTIAGIGGFGLSTLLGGELFKGVGLAGEAAEHVIAPAEAIGEASLGTRLAAKAANYATQGALMSSPQALIDAAAGDPKKAAETLLWGIGAGGVLGAGGELLSSAASGVGEALVNRIKDPKTQEWLDNWANERTLKAFGAERSQLNKLSKERMAELANFAHDEGLLKVGSSRQEIGDLVEKAKDKWGGELGNTVESLDGLLHRGEGAAVGPKPPPEIINAAIKPGQLGDAIRAALDGPEMQMPMNADQARALDQVAKSADALESKLVNGERVIPFKDAQDFVSALRKKWVGAVNRSLNEGGVKGLETVTALDQMKASAYQVARDFVHGAADNVAKASGEPKLVGAMVAAKQNYAKLAQLENFAATLDRVGAGNKFVGLTDTIHMGNGPLSSATQALGAAIGSLAGPGGAIVGSQIGKVPGIALDFMAKKWMEDKGLVAISAIAKRAAKEGPEVFSAVMASEGAKRLEATMGAVQDTIRNMAVRGIVNTNPSNASDHMRHLLGGSVQGLDADQSYGKLSQRLTNLANNPTALAAATSNAAAPFGAGSPQLGAAYQAQIMQAIQYLHAALPKPPAPAAPFEPDDWAPSAQDKLAFHDKAEIVNNPMRAMIHMERGTLSDAHLDALQQVYPSVLGEMRNSILAFSAKHPDVKLPLSERRSVGKILGTPLDAISQNLPALQATWSHAPTQQPPGMKAPKGKIKNMPSAASAFTGSQGPAPVGT
jgi:hypothetical protein